MAAGDLNNDGLSDIVVADWNSNVVDVLLQKDNGGFGSVVRMPSATGAFTVALADLNQDTNLDIVVGNHVSSSVSVFLGDGTGAFLPRVDYPMPSLPSVVAVGDVTGDGKLDVVAAADTRVCVLAGNGLGQLGTAVSTEVGAPLWGLALGDLDGDGDLDVATNYNGPFIVLWNSGNGTLSPLGYTNNIQSRALAIASVPETVIRTSSRPVTPKMESSSLQAMEAAASSNARRFPPGPIRGVSASRISITTATPMW
jgi:hypothetical protein